MMFLDCPAYLDHERTVRCGLPAEVRCRFTMRSTDGPIEAAMIRCPGRPPLQRGHRIPHLGQHGQPRSGHCCGYYVFDDGSTTVRDFLAGLLQAHGLTLPEASIPGPVAAGLARALDVAWRIARRPGDPPITRMIVELNRGPFLISDARARRELRYQPVITREQGIQRLHDAMRATVQPASPGLLSADKTSGTLSTKTVNRPPAPHSGAYRLFFRAPG
jgi:hypothetical protein